MVESGLGELPHARVTEVAVTEVVTVVVAVPAGALLVDSSLNAATEMAQ